LLLSSSDLDLLFILINISLQLGNFSFILKDHAGVSGCLDHVSQFLDSCSMLIPHVSVVSDGNSVLIDLSLVVNDSCSILISSPFEDLPRSGVRLSLIESLFLELVNLDSLVVMMMRSSLPSSCGGCGCGGR
jgi:hypothetical protein